MSYAWFASFTVRKQHPICRFVLTHCLCKSAQPTCTLKAFEPGVDLLSWCGTASTGRETSVFSKLSLVQFFFVQLFKLCRLVFLKFRVEWHYNMGKIGDKPYEWSTESREEARYLSQLLVDSGFM